MHRDADILKYFKCDDESCAAGLYDSKDMVAHYRINEF